MKVVLFFTLLMFIACGDDVVKNEPIIAPKSLTYSTSVLTIDTEKQTEVHSVIPKVDAGSSSVKSFELFTPVTGISINKENGKVTVSNIVEAGKTFLLDITVSNETSKKTFSDAFKVISKKIVVAPSDLQYIPNIMKYEKGISGTKLSEKPFVKSGSSTIQKFELTETITGIKINPATGIVSVNDSIAEKTTFKLAVRVFNEDTFQVFKDVYTVTTSEKVETPSNLHLTFGNPSNATDDTAQKQNYLMIKNGYALSFNGVTGNPNWVSWHLDDSWRGSASRQNDYRPDPILPSGWKQGNGSGFGGGYDRGHITPSGDRTKSVSINSETFLMTNFFPQASNNNQGPWAQFENYLRDLSSDEKYIIAGGYGSKGNTEKGGNVNIPEYTWKVVLVLPKGENDLSRVTSSTRTIAIWMENSSSIDKGSSWKIYRKSIDFIEEKTKFDFFSELPDAVENTIESKVDSQ